MRWRGKCLGRRWEKIRPRESEHVDQLQTGEKAFVNCDSLRARSQCSQMSQMSTHSAAASTSRIQSPACESKRPLCYRTKSHTKSPVTV